MQPGFFTLLVSQAAMNAMGSSALEIAESHQGLTSPLIKHF